MAGCKVSFVGFKSVCNFCNFGGIGFGEFGALHKMEAANHEIREHCVAKLSLKRFHHIQNAVVRTATEKDFLSTSCKKKILFMMKFILDISTVAKFPKTFVCRRKRPGTLFNSKKLKLVIKLSVTFQKLKLRQRENLFINSDIAVALLFSVLKLKKNRS